MKRRYPFLLFEIALGLTLIVLSLKPLFGNTYQRLQRQRAALRIIESEWRADWDATVWQEALAQHTFPLPHKGDEPLRLDSHTTLTCTGEKSLSQSGTSTLYHLALGKRIYKFYHVDSE